MQSKWIETWKDIRGYEGLYQISSHGRVKSLSRKPSWEFHQKSCSRNHKERYIQAEIAKNGYKRVGLCKNGKRTRYNLHRLLAVHFIPNPQNLPTVNHKNGIKTDNSLDNLEWCSYSYNNFHAWRFLNKKAYNAKKVQCIETGEIFESAAAASNKYGRTRGSVLGCASGKTKISCGLHWRFV